LIVLATLDELNSSTIVSKIKVIKMSIKKENVENYNMVSLGAFCVS
jgi:hypothetical protein